MRPPNRPPTDAEATLLRRLLDDGPQKIDEQIVNELSAILQRAAGDKVKLTPAGRRYAHAELGRR